MFVLIDTRRKAPHKEYYTHKTADFGVSSSSDDQRYKTPALFELYFVLRSDCIHILVDHNNMSVYFSTAFTLLLLFKKIFCWMIGKEKWHTTYVVFL